MITDLVACTIRGNYQAEIVTRFGVADLADAVEGAKEFARIMFEETGLQYLSHAPEARPHPEDTVVEITLRSEVTGDLHDFRYQIPEESQPNADVIEGEVFYRF